MRLININQKQAKVQAPKEAIYAACHPGNTRMQVTHAMETGNELLLRTHAKAYYKGGGWWLISGYHADGTDVSISCQEIYLWGTP